MFDTEQKNEVEVMIKAAVKDTVNGQIVGLRADFNAHVAKIEPYMQAAAGLGIIYKALIVVGSLAGVWIAIGKVWEYLHPVTPVIH